MHIKTLLLITLTLLICSCNNPRESNLSFDEIYPDGEEIVITLDRSFIRQHAFCVDGEEYWAYSASIFLIPYLIAGAPFYYGSGVKAYITFDRNKEMPWQEIRWGKNIVRRPKIDEGTNTLYLIVKGTYKGYSELSFTDPESISLLGKPNLKKPEYPIQSQTFHGSCIVLPYYNKKIYYHK